jgi:transposase
MDAKSLRRRARREGDPDMRRRLEVVALSLEDASISAIHRATVMDRSRVRLWLARFRAEGIDGLRARIEQQGRAALTDDELVALARLALVERTTPAFGMPLGAADLAERARVKLGLELTRGQVVGALKRAGLEWRGGGWRLPAPSE